MSKLLDNPAKIAPRRALIIALALSLILFGVSFFVSFNLLLTLLFLWLGTIANLISFQLIVIGASRVTDKAATGEKPSLGANLTLRYAMYITVLVCSGIFGGLVEILAALVGIQMVQWAIRLDRMLG